MQHHPYRRLLAGLVACSALLAGCPSTTETPPSPEASSETSTTTTTTTTTAYGTGGGSAVKPPKVQAEGEVGKMGGTLRISQLGDPKTFNVLMAQETSSTFVLTFVYEALAEQHGMTAKVEPALAEKWDVSKDGKTYTFTLRDGLQWSDGHPLTADDVVFTFNDIVANMKIPTDIRDVIKVDGKLPKVEKIDKLHVRFTMAKPFAPFIRSVGAGVPILPKHILTPTLAADTRGNPKFVGHWGLNTDVKSIVANGPYTIAEYAAGQRLILQKNPNYYRTDKAGNRLPYLDKVVIQLVKDADTEVLKFKAGEMDILRGVSAKDFELLKRGETAGKYKVLKGGPTFGTNFLMFNMKQAKGKGGKPAVDPIKQKWFNNVKFRQAVAYSLDRQSMVRNFFRNLAKVQDASESALSPFFKEDVKKYDYDVKKAEKLLTEAGFKKVGGVLQDAQGNPVQFTLLTNSNNTTRVALTAQIKADLEKLGMKITFQPMDFNAMVKKIDETFDWEAIVIGLTGGVEPNSGANVWRSEGQMHMFRRNEPKATEWEKEIDKIFEQGAVTLDEAKRKEIYNRYQDIAAEQVPFIYTVNQEALTAVRDNVGNVMYSALNLNPGPLWNLYELYLK